ncbi:MAG: hypothetical protein EZS28_009776 [Streblomastix strix]|uniref:Uncharacterized protein n=1 Tax=Streblomastix strix TaxID=222440 RepID=A0A5J4WIN9_9EUKA|nr:MAG: hypothetical protein EZS28_009776 [Streblomastix strix]
MHQEYKAIKYLEQKVVMVFEYQVINQLDNMVIMKMAQKDIIIELGFEVIKVLNKVENQHMEQKEQVVEALITIFTFTANYIMHSNLYAYSMVEKLIFLHFIELIIIDIEFEEEPIIIIGFQFVVKLTITVEQYSDWDYIEVIDQSKEKFVII